MDHRDDRYAQQLHHRAPAAGRRRAEWLLTGVALVVVGMVLLNWLGSRLRSGIDAADSQIDPPPDGLFIPILVGWAVCWLVGICCAVHALASSPADRPIVPQ